MPKAQEYCIAASEGICAAMPQCCDGSTVADAVQEQCRKLGERCVRAAVERRLSFIGSALQHSVLGGGSLALDES